MANRCALLIAFLVSAWGVSTSARIFRLKNETFAAYFGGSYGPSSLLQTHFAGTSGTGNSIDKTVSTNLGGDFGFVITGKSLGLRLGVELLKPAPLTKGSGTNAGGQTMYEFESNISAVIPKVALELNLKTSESWRAFLTFGAGTATAQFKNSYTLSSEGQASYPGLSDFSDEATGTAELFDGGLGFETLLNDTTTVAFLVLNRHLTISNYRYKNAVTNFSGAQSSGASVTNEDGMPKSSDFSGYAVTMLFRFYLGK